MRAVCWAGKGDVRVERVPDPVILNPRDARSIRPSSSRTAWAWKTHRAMYRTFRDKRDSCIKVVTKPDGRSATTVDPRSPQA
jgi:threonine dehydrogenase-like Zn-dependent dehydrogenase